MTTVFGSDDFAAGVAIRKDGKIVAAGAALVAGNRDFAVARFEKDGSPDRSFDGDGKVTTDFGLNAPDFANALALQKDGKIVVVGRTVVGNDHFALARYQKNGRLDRSFSGDGLVITIVGNSDSAESVAIQKDGKIVATGFASPGNSVAVARYLPH